MKKTFKIIALYLIIGIIIAIAITIFGGYENLVLHNTMGNMGINGYLLLMLCAVFIWLPVFAYILFSTNILLTFAYAKVILGIFVLAFIILSTIIIKAKKKL